MHTFRLSCPNCLLTYTEHLGLIGSDTKTLNENTGMIPSSSMLPFVYTDCTALITWSAESDTGKCDSLYHLPYGQSKLLNVTKRTSTVLGKPVLNIISNEQSASSAWILRHTCRANASRTLYEDKMPLRRQNRRNHRFEKGFRRLFRSEIHI